MADRRGGRGSGGGGRRTRRGDDYYDEYYDPQDDPYADYPQPPKRGKIRAWAPLFVVLVVLGAFGGCSYGAYSYFKGKYGPPPDFANTACPAADPNKDPVRDQGKVSVEIPRNAIGSSIGKILFDAGVVKSVKAYVNAANDNQASNGISANTYDICKGISGAQAVAELLKSGNIEKNSQIQVYAHEWSTDVVADLIKKRKFPQADFDAAIRNNTIGLPAWAKVGGQFSVEGLLEPGIYPLASGDTAQSVLTRMVAARMTVLTAMGFEAKAAALPCGSAKCTPEQVLTIASIAEYEVPEPTDVPKIADAVLAHLKYHEALGVDSTTLYGLQKKVPLNQTLLSDPNNLYTTGAKSGHNSLPPGPIGIPSDSTLQLTLTPSKDPGNYYWCAKNGITSFFSRNSYSKFNSVCNKN